LSLEFKKTLPRILPIDANCSKKISENLRKTTLARGAVLAAEKR
jgi:hypothetical protein